MNSETLCGALSAAGSLKSDLGWESEECEAGDVWSVNGKRRWSMQQEVLLQSFESPTAYPSLILLSASMSTTQLRRPWTACHASAVLFSQ